MSELYWITVLGNLNGLGFIFTIIGFIGVLISFIRKSDGYSWKKSFKFSCVGVGLGVLLLTFIPSVPELYMIYGVGGTIDYIKENPASKQLPDKCVKILDKWVDEQLQKEKK